MDIGQTVERYDFESGVWNMHDKTATPRFAFGAMEYEGNQKMQLDVDLEPTFRFTYMRYYIDKQKDPIV